ncbi:Afadin/alpha-actinin-binding [Ceraceosorus bombacis]|uniref:Afadin/alpha-actinin-binding n=1 Tax=Ceraceosorus bombacis TaxID=401625 RepID=A0A0P1BJQ4_9BASI|nr:Afadin/alpha-actinin-binding [Ceraceosorus bombacis]
MVRDVQASKASEPVHPPPADVAAGAPADDSLLSLASSSSSHPTFDQLNALLLSRGYLSEPLNVSSLPTRSLDALCQALHSLLGQRAEDVDLRDALAARNRALNSRAERMERELQEEREARLSAERKSERERNRNKHLADEGKALEANLKAAQSDLQSSRRALQTVKASAHQSALSSTRQSTRQRAAYSEATAATTRGCFPTARCVPFAFLADDAHGPFNRAGTGGVEAALMREAEERASRLADENIQYKAMLLDAANDVKEATRQVVALLPMGGQGDACTSLSSSSSSLYASLNDPWTMDQLFATSMASPTHVDVHKRLRAVLNTLQEGTSSLRALRVEESLKHAMRVKDLDDEITALSSRQEPDKARELGEAAAQAHASSTGFYHAKQTPREEKREMERKLLDAITRLGRAEEQVSMLERERRRWKDALKSGTGADEQMAEVVRLRQQSEALKLELEHARSAIKEAQTANDRAVERLRLERLSWEEERMQRAPAETRGATNRDESLGVIAATQRAAPSTTRRVSFFGDAKKQEGDCSAESNTVVLHSLDASESKSTSRPGPSAAAHVTSVRRSSRVSEKSRQSDSSGETARTGASRRSAAIDDEIVDAHASKSSRINDDAIRSTENERSTTSNSSSRRKRAKGAVSEQEASPSPSSRSELEEVSVALTVEPHDGSRAVEEDTGAATEKQGGRRTFRSSNKRARQEEVEHVASDNLNTSSNVPSTLISDVERATKRTLSGRRAVSSTPLVDRSLLGQRGKDARVPNVPLPTASSLGKSGAPFSSSSSRSNSDKPGIKRARTALVDVSAATLNNSLPEMQAKADQAHPHPKVLPKSRQQQASTSERARATRQPSWAERQALARERVRARNAGAGAGVGASAGAATVKMP